MDAARTTSTLSTGIVVLTLVAVAWGGTFVLRVTGGGVPANDLQRSFFRAGHAHAGVLIVLGLLLRVVTDVPDYPAWAAFGPDAVLYAAVLMPLGFFLSVLGREPVAPNRWRYALYAGAALLTVGLVLSGSGLIAAA